ncbi:MAG TPA: Asp-tRNA(Asn)/Glu-tRNA(Gln) amidotransferase GatCAB subunit B, partial [Cytophagales bacterium]|nr:Asp-tRNA(Asn)/Glu-tRNA(Gln) amidotransferase GatCAB subunit B [Cytophagales bacterium]
MAEHHQKYIPTIGLEVHAQLNTESKIFAPDATAFGQDPNTQISVVSLAHPGTLPKLNRAVVEKAMRMGIACGSKISPIQIFDRKNYFYPDLPKGYQITQDHTPICVGGEVPIRTEAGERTVKLNRIHLEEDAGKSIHADGEPDTRVDFNRAGVPLIEIVTEPVIDSAEEAAAFMAQIRRLVRFLDVCDGNMEEGSLRCDANISIRPVGQEKLGAKVEVKNMNSLRHVARAVNYEIARQSALLDAGEPIISETRTYNVQQNKTYGMRTKEELNDYRYFPDPDLSPLVISDSWLQEVKSAMPELPWALEQRLQSEYNLPAMDAGVLTDTKAMADFFLAMVDQGAKAKAASNWLMGPVKGYLNDQ